VEELAVVVPALLVPRPEDDLEELVGAPVAGVVVDADVAVGLQLVGCPPVTTLRSSRPPLIRSSVAAIRAATGGFTNPGRNATRKRIEVVRWARVAAMIQASWQPSPVGTSIPSNPADSAARATRVRCSTVGGTSVEASPRRAWSPKDGTNQRR